MTRYHGFSPRTGDLQPLGQYVQSGKYGRMFPELPPFRPDEKALEELGKAMFNEQGEDKSGDNIKILAGYTYFGQFIDHDITFDPTSLEETIIDPLALTNYRTPKLDLDSVYGGGPSVQPYLYQRSDQNKQTKLFEIGSTKPTKPNGDLDSFPNDLPRSSTGFALIGDLRNDENLIVAQLHLAFLKFHNKVVKEIEQKIINLDYIYSSNNIFEVARNIVIWHYQWLVLHDFLPKIINQEQLNIVLKEGRSFYNYKEEPFIPVEFSVAAFRLGHSMVRSKYNYNHKFSPPSGSPATLTQLLAFTGSNKGSNVPIFSNWIIDWRRFFEIDNRIEPNFSRTIDPFLNSSLCALPIADKENNLAIRNLQRGRMLGLPSGQRVAKFMGLKPLTQDEITEGSDGRIAKKNNFHIETPLWYYILKEAQVKEKGRCLGDVGSRILAEVFVGLLEGDSSSFVVQHRNWKPILPAKVPGTFTMVDLLNFVNDINPI